jgi:AGZA family xanthine/uracil permease-like MFS transporter
MADTPQQPAGRQAAQRTSARTEIVAGVVTFMTMAYILFVNPSILGNAPGANKPAIIVGTGLTAGIITLLMGLWADYPIALAPGMGLNAFVTFAVIIGMGVPYDVAMSLVVIEGLIILLLVATRLREVIFLAIPLNLRRAIAGGIGLFIALIGFVNSGLVIANPATLITFAPWNIQHPGPVITLAAVLLIGVLMARKVKGAILVGILFATAVAMLTGIQPLPTGIVSTPAMPHFTLHALPAALRLSYIPIIFALVMSDFFDMMGTVVGLAEQAGYVTAENPRIPRLNRILFVDGLAAVVGGALGVSSATTFVESAAGIGEGGRRGLTAITVGVLFLLSIFFTPLIAVVPAVATAPALIVVGFLMLGQVAAIDWSEVTEALPAFITLATIPFTYNIGRGIGYGFLSYLVINLLAGKRAKLTWPLWVVGIIFAVFFAMGH